MARWHSCNGEFESEEALARHDVEVHGAVRGPVGTCCGFLPGPRDGRGRSAS